MADFTFKQNSTFPFLTATLSDAKGPVDLTTAKTLKLFLAKDTLHKKTGTVEVTGDPKEGKIRYKWEANDTDVSGEFNAEIEVEWEDGTKSSFPSDGYFTVEFVADLGPVEGEV